MWKSLSLFLKKQNDKKKIMDKRLIINAGIEKVYIRDTKDEFRIISVSDWIENDESLDCQLGY